MYDWILTIGKARVVARGDRAYRWTHLRRPCCGCSGEGFPAEDTDPLDVNFHVACKSPKKDLNTH